MSFNGYYGPPPAPAPPYIYGSSTGQNIGYQQQYFTATNIQPLTQWELNMNNLKEAMANFVGLPASSQNLDAVKFLMIQQLKLLFPNENLDDTVSVTAHPNTGELVIKYPQHLERIMRDALKQRAVLPEQPEKYNIHTFIPDID